MTRRSSRLASLCVVLAIVGMAALPYALARLDQARERRARLSALCIASVPSPQPIVAGDAAFRGAAGAGAAALASTVQELALREGALLERSEARPAPVAHLVVRRVIVSGSARTMLRFVEAIEARAPVVRLARYRLAATGTGQALRLEADLVMAVAAG